MSKKKLTRRNAIMLGTAATVALVFGAPALFTSYNRYNGGRWVKILIPKPISYAKLIWDEKQKKMVLNDPTIIKVWDKEHKKQITYNINEGVLLAGADKDGNQIVRFTVQAAEIDPKTGQRTDEKYLQTYRVPEKVWKQLRDGDICYVESGLRFPQDPRNLGEWSGFSTVVATSITRKDGTVLSTPQDLVP